MNSLGWRVRVKLGPDTWLSFVTSVPTLRIDARSEIKAQADHLEEHGWAIATAEGLGNRTLRWVLVLAQKQEGDMP